MTLLEATIEAWKRVGYSQDAIDFRIKAADAEHPDAKFLMGSPVKDGKEEEFIEQMVALERRLMANPELAEAAYKAAMEKLNKQNERN